MRCGIDFGTSNTVLAVAAPAGTNGSFLVPLEENQVTIPTAIFFPEGNAEILFGRRAVEAYLDGREGRFMRSLKRVLGTSLMDQTVLVNGSRTTFDVIVGRFLSHIKQQAEQHLGTTLSHVTMGRPVHFQDNDPAADERAETQLRRIAHHIGFTDVAFQYEPIAAALAHEQRMTGENLALVVDIGGGTSDFSVIRLNSDFTAGRDRKQDILVNTGIRVGGNDCDKAINLESAMPLLGMGTRYGTKDLDMPVLLYHELSEWVKINWCYTPNNLAMVRELMKESHAPEKLKRFEVVLEEQLGHKILHTSEMLKIALCTGSAHDVATAQENMDFLERDLTATLDRATMDNVLDHVLAPVSTLMNETLVRAGVTPQDISLVILTGGSTGLPLFMHWVTTRFPHAVISQEDRLGSVGQGLLLGLVL